MSPRLRSDDLSHGPSTIPLRHLAATPADLVRWLRLPCVTPRNGWRTTPVLKSPRMFRDAEEWSQDHSGAHYALRALLAPRAPSTSTEKYSVLYFSVPVRSNFASERA